MNFVRGLLLAAVVVTTVLSFVAPAALPEPNKFFKDRPSRYKRPVIVVPPLFFGGFRGGRRRGRGHKHKHDHDHDHFHFLGNDYGLGYGLGYGGYGVGFGLGQGFGGYGFGRK